MVELRARAWKVPGPYTAIFGAGRLHLLDGGAAGEGVEGARAEHSHLWGRAPAPALFDRSIKSL
jgi:hypothetical protein